jgi:hypothetical protein
MAKSAKRTTKDVASTAADRSASPSTLSARATDRDIARRAYALYLARGGAHGHDVDDWLLAERQLRMR